MSDTNNRPRCPECGSKNVARLQWGRPVWSERLEHELETGKAELAGCFVDKYSERWQCNDCHHRFGNIELGFLLEKKKQPDHITAHKQCIRNWETIQKSTLCGCFYCETIFVPSQIEEWIEESDGKETALCPYCGIDSVIGDASGYPLTPEFLKQMHDYWFKEMARKE